MNSPLLTAILLAMLVVLVGRSLWHSFRRPPAQLVRDWARAHALTLTPANQPVVEYYVATAGRLRAVGVIAGVIVPLLAASAFGFGSTFGFGHIWALLGYLVGAFVAEVTLGRPLPAAARHRSCLAGSPTICRVDCWWPSGCWPRCAW